MYDPQQLDLAGKVKALVVLGRIPLASEVPLWCMFGCLLSSQVFPSARPVGDGPFRNLDVWAMIQCMLVVWGTNISINYGNDYFDWNMDRPGMVATISKQVEARKRLAAKEKMTENGKGAREDEALPEAEKSELHDKIMGDVSRILHDGTFPPYVALLLAALVQFLLITMIVTSRNTPGGTPFRGLALQIGIVCTILSQGYVGPPLRLHYHGWGELISALLLSPVSVLFGMVGHYTAVTNRSVSVRDLFGPSSRSSSGFSLDTQLWTFLAAIYAIEQARIFIMHIPDIHADRIGGKLTFVVRVGQAVASRLYIAFNAVGMFLLAIFAIQFKQANKGRMMSRIAGATVDKGQAEAGFSARWLLGLAVAATYMIPIMAVTAKSLFVALVKSTSKDRVSDIDRSIRSSFPDAVPVLKLTDLAKIVSLQCLVTPVFMSAVLAFAAFAK